jgi:hypothetical protein
LAKFSPSEIFKKAKTLKHHAQALQVSGERASQIMNAPGSCGLNIEAVLGSRPSGHWRFAVRGEDESGVGDPRKRLN